MKMIKILFFNLIFVNAGILFGSEEKAALVINKPNLVFDRISSAEFSPDGLKVLTYSFPDKMAHLINLETGEKYQIFLDVMAFLSSAKFDQKNTKALFSVDKMAVIVDLNKIITGKDDYIIQELKGHTGSLSSAEFNKKGNWVITTSDDKTARIWDVKTGKTLAILNHDIPVEKAQFNENDSKVITLSPYENTAFLWDISNLSTQSKEILESIE